MRMYFMLKLLGGLRLCFCFGFGIGLGGVAHDFDVVREFLARSAASVGDELFEQCFHLGDLLRHQSGEVLGFAKVMLEVVELDGLRWIATFAPAA